MNLNEAVELTENDYMVISNNKLELENEINDVKEKAVLDNTIDSVSNALKENIAFEIDKLNLNESIWKKMSKSAIADAVKVAIEAVLKGVLKKKFGINFSTFNEMKDTLESVMNGDLKEVLKTSSDAAIDSLKKIDGVTKTTIKTVKNAVIDKTIDSEKYEIINKQTKLLNRISNNCEKFNEAMSLNDEKTMKNKVNSIRKDMQNILPIRETINKAQAVLDKYTFWQNKGKLALTNEENELIDKLNVCA